MTCLIYDMFMIMNTTLYAFLFMVHFCNENTNV